MQYIDATFNPEKQSLIYHNGRYWSLSPIEKLEQEKREKIKDIMEKYKKTVS
jgi:hypothetical protein